ncbi:hypothetical protein CGCA056_v012497 [Colletotrichum aenigma]|uniref:uncharacterized protein n=1 Tax=Colletotrichum aenigma TaxID=1215731 RepID=UPI001872C72B|nr:uncharacterized protein CGCA056_v012497 [Colletotrichum aenigma]KAF5512953.1 hypothetical protein CGCA056_v012497 [Colletotrichum aenigma]
MLFQHISVIIAEFAAGSLASIADCKGSFYAGVCQDVHAPGARHEALTQSCCQSPHGTTYHDGPGTFCCTTSDSAAISYMSSCCSNSGKNAINFNPA